MEQRKILEITTEKQLRTYMHPLRQKILFELSLHPEGRTAKQLADALGVAPSSAGHHLGALEQLGVVELDHTELIHGFTAKFYRTADVDVNIHPSASGRQIRRAMLENDMGQRIAHLDQLAGWSKAQGLDIGQAVLRHSLRSGTLYLTEQEARQLNQWLIEKLAAYERPHEDAHLYEYAFLTADLTLWQQLRGEADK